jgi:hypothetical protein
MSSAKLGPLEFLLATLAAGLVAFVGRETVRTWRHEAALEQAALDAAAHNLEARQFSATRDVSAGPRARGPALQPAPGADLARSRIAEFGAGTYIQDLVRGQDSALYRWSDHTIETLRVWVQPRANLHDWHPTFVGLARDAFPEWGAAGFPVRFTFVLDSLTADVRVMWVQRFPAADGQRVGRADRRSDGAGWIRRADLFVAVHDSAGRPIPEEWIAAIARHEVGHALGLGHTRDSTAIMFPTSRTSAISDADRATLRLLYTLPPGSLKQRD